MLASFKESIRDQIVQRAELCLKEQGAEKFTIRWLATHLNISVGSIYNYFPDKEAVLRLIYAKTCAECLSLLQKTAKNSPPSKENFLKLILALATFRLENGYRYQKIAPAIGSINDIRELQDLREYFNTKLQELNLKSIQTKDDLFLAARSIISLVEGSIYLADTLENLISILTFALKSLLAGWDHPKRNL